MTTARRLSDYALFEGIQDEDLKTLLPCLNAGLTVLRAGDSMRWEPDRVGMITEGALARQDAGFSPGEVTRPDLDASPDALSPGETMESVLETMGPGSVLLTESPLELTAQTDTTILRMDRDMVYGPCWFSCSFHHRIADNLNRDWVEA